jgi:hypothetical protein
MRYYERRRSWPVSLSQALMLRLGHTSGSVLPAVLGEGG